MNKLEVLENNITNLKRVFPNLFLQGLDCKSVLFINQLSFSIGVEEKIETDLLTPNLNSIFRLQQRKCNEIKFNTNVYLDNIEQLVQCISPVYLEESLGFFFNIANRLNCDYNSTGMIKFSATFKEYNDVISFKFDYIINCYDFKIILTAKNIKKIEIKIFPFLNEFKPILLFLTEKDDLENLFTSICKKITSKIDFYDLNDNMNSEDLYIFLKNNYEDISKLNEIFNY
jgi:hypothetical protein